MKFDLFSDIVVQSWILYLLGLIPQSSHSVRNPSVAYCLAIQKYHQSSQNISPTTGVGEYFHIPTEYARVQLLDPMNMTIEQNCVDYVIKIITKY